MNVKEFKIHLMRGLMRPEYFYIPVLKHKKKEGIFVEVLDLDGDPFYVNKIKITYMTFSYLHGYSYHSPIYRYDTENKGYAFEEDTVDVWRYPLPWKPDFVEEIFPDPSPYELLPLPDFTENAPYADDMEHAELAESSELSVTYKFTDTKKGLSYKDGGFVYTDKPCGRSLIELKNMPAGIYRVEVGDPMTDPTMSDYLYYPDYYRDYDTEKYPSAEYDHTLCQIDRNQKFSGFYTEHLHDTTTGYETGLDFIFITEKFKNNTMPIIANKSYIPAPSQEGFVYVLTRLDIPGYTGESFPLIDLNIYTRDVYYNRFSAPAELPNATAVGGRILGLKMYHYETNNGATEYKYLGTYGIMQSFTKLSGTNADGVTYLCERSNTIKTVEETKYTFTNDYIFNGYDDVLSVECDKSKSTGRPVNYWIADGDIVSPIAVDSDGYPSTLILSGGYAASCRSALGTLSIYECSLYYQREVTRGGMSYDEYKQWLNDNFSPLTAGGTLNLKRKIDFIPNDLGQYIWPVHYNVGEHGGVAVNVCDQLMIHDVGIKTRITDIDAVSHYMPRFTKQSIGEVEETVYSAETKSTQYLVFDDLVKLMQDENWQKWNGAPPTDLNNGETRRYYYYDGIVDMDTFFEHLYGGNVILDEDINSDW